MNPITKPQLSKIHVLLNQFNILEEKANLVSHFTKGRTTSSKEMTQNEAMDLLRHLSAFDPCDRMRRKVFALAYESGIIYGDTPEDLKMNVAKLNVFLKGRGAVKKDINKMNKAELIIVVTQFEQMKKHNDLNKAAQVTKNMLSDLNIESAFKSRSKSH